jgi:hypothetical protein
VNVFNVKLAYEDGGTKKDVFVVASDMESALRLAQNPKVAGGYGWVAQTSYKLMDIAAIEGVSE